MRSKREAVDLMMTVLSNMYPTQVVRSMQISSNNLAAAAITPEDWRIGVTLGGVAYVSVKGFMDGMCECGQLP